MYLPRTPQVRQKVGITTDKTFKATGNGRNEAMFREASDFSLHLRAMERDLRVMAKQVNCESKPSLGVSKILHLQLTHL